MKTLHTLIAAALIAGSSAASAVEPIALNDAELDNVTAGAQVLVTVAGVALASAVSVGPLAVSATETGIAATATAVDVNPFYHVVVGGAAAHAASVSAN